MLIFVLIGQARIIKLMPYVGSDLYDVFNIRNWLLYQYTYIRNWQHWYSLSS